MKTTKQVLIDARERIACGWCQEALAKGQDGTGLHYDSRFAVSWCALGATCAVTGVLVERDSAIGALMEAVELQSIADWNDDPSRTQSDVLAAFDRAIAQVQS